MTLTPSIISGNDVLRVEGLSKAYENKKLFQDISFEIKRGERVALIGQNGTGKTTILKILNEKVNADAGSFTLGTNVKIGYYDQEQQVLHMELKMCVFIRMMLVYLCVRWQMREKVQMLYLWIHHEAAVMRSSCHRL